ncbi:MAG: NTP transferase domain-containing protein [Candidatus Omnitrophota bacterium]
MTVILQARMSSQRLPGKVLARVQNKSLLEFTIERLKQSIYIGDIIVATSTEKSDDPVAQYCRSNKIEVFRGELDNVAARFKAVIEQDGLSSFIRISGDSPLIDSHIIDAGIEMFENNSYDIVTNVLNRTFPKGQSFEIFRSETFLREFSNIRTAEEQEHVTKYFYKNKDRFNIFNLECISGNFSHVNLSIDTKEDFSRFEALINDRSRPVCDLGWDEIMKLYKALDQHECTN